MSSTVAQYTVYSVPSYLLRICTFDFASFYTFVIKIRIPDIHLTSHVSSVRISILGYINIFRLDSNILLGC